MSNEIKNSLAIIQQAKAQNKKYSGNRSSERSSNNHFLNSLGKGRNKESITQKYKRNKREKDMNLYNNDQFLMKSQDKCNVKNIDISRKVTNFPADF